MTRPTTCSACGAEMYFLVLEGRRGAKANPINADPTTDGTANILPDVEHGTYRIVPKGEGTHLSHFVTCPGRDRFGKKARP